MLSDRAHVAAAQALAEKYRAEGQMAAQRVGDLEKRLPEQRHMADGYADRLERVMQTALGQMGQVAEARARPADSRPAVVVPGGLGPAVVVSPAAVAAGRCRHCQSALQSGAEFCDQCAKKQ